MSAILSSCGAYRYRLERSLAPPNIAGPIGLVIMVNPSTADALADDATIRRLIGFGTRWGWGHLLVGNLFAFRATDVRELARAHDPVGVENDRHIYEMMCAASQLVVAWGAESKLPRHLRMRWQRVMFLAGQASLIPQSIGAPTKDGSPCHPLMLSYDRVRQDWPWKRPRP